MAEGERNNIWLWCSWEGSGRMSGPLCPPHADRNGAVWCLPCSQPCHRVFFGCRDTPFLSLESRACSAEGMQELEQWGWDGRWEEGTSSWGWSCPTCLGLSHGTHGDREETAAVEQGTIGKHQQSENLNKRPNYLSCHKQTAPCLTSPKKEKSHKIGGLNLSHVHLFNKKTHW